MKQELTKAIDRAIDNGWLGKVERYEVDIDDNDIIIHTNWELREVDLGDGEVEWVECDSHCCGKKQVYSINDIILDPGFWKALCGEDNDWHPVWRYHMNQCVKAIQEGKDPIEYIGGLA